MPALSKANVLVGINAYPNPNNNLRGCINDIVDMAYFIASKNKVYPKENIRTLTNKKQLTILPRIFHVDIPTDLSNAINKCKTDAECEQVGTEWLIQQSKELKAAGVPVLHYYTLGKPKVIRDVCQQIF